MTEDALTPEEEQLLRRLVALMIPAVPDQKLPGADDEQIFARLREKSSGSVGRLKADLHDLAAEQDGIEALNALGSLAFADWFADHAARWQSHAFFRRLAPLLARAYYEDFRVQQAYSRRPGPPFPEGYVLIEGDWSLLDAVRDRPPIYRR